MALDLIPVQSEMLEAVGWEAPGNLVLVYKGGRQYLHQGVSKAKFSDLLSAESKGQFVNKHVKKQHPGKQI